MEDIRRVLDKAEPFEREVQDRHGRWFLLRILPYRNKARIDGVVLTLIDVSPLKQAEEEAREAVRRRDHFLAMLSHELRNPLGAILNSAHLMERGGDRRRRPPRGPGGHRPPGPADGALAGRLAGRVADHAKQDRDPPRSGRSAGRGGRGRAGSAADDRVSPASVESRDRVFARCSSWAMRRACSKFR